jgi:hypothetical protein
MSATLIQAVTACLDQDEDESCQTLPVISPSVFPPLITQPLLAILQDIVTAVTAVLPADDDLEPLDQHGAVVSEGDRSLSKLEEEELHSLHEVCQTLGAALVTAIQQVE